MYKVCFSGDSVRKSEKQGACSIYIMTAIVENRYHTLPSLPYQCLQYPPTLRFTLKTSTTRLKKKVSFTSLMPSHCLAYLPTPYHNTLFQSYIFYLVYQRRASDAAIQPLHALWQGHLCCRSKRSEDEGTSLHCVS